jgi:(S)-2-hydroxyglutarate dehydrogenase
VLNAAGAYADRVARDFGFGDGYRILPFKGRYLQGAGAGGGAAAHLPGAGPALPVPGRALDGGGGRPACGSGRRPRPCWGGSSTAGGWGARGGGGRRGLARLMGVARERRRSGGWGCLELRRRSRGLLLREAGRLARGCRARRRGPPAAGHPGPAGGHARRWTLEDDFVYQADHRSFHVLNAVSPAFTSALPLAEHIVDIIHGVGTGGTRGSAITLRVATFTGCGTATEESCIRPRGAAGPRPNVSREGSRDSSA